MVKTPTVTLNTLK